MTAPLIVALLLVATASAAIAGEPSEVVQAVLSAARAGTRAVGARPFIDPAQEGPEPERRNQAGKARTVVSIRRCPSTTPDFDPAEVASTLMLEEVVSGGEATVLAKFMAEGQEQAVQWRLKDIGGGWRIFDMVSMSKDWALSRFQCE